MNRAALSPPRPLLLLVDLQQDYLGTRGLEPAAGAIVERVAALLHGCRAASIPVAHVWTTVSREDDRRMPHWKRDGRWICVEGTSGHQPPAALLPDPSERIIHKRFFNGFGSGELEPLLTRDGIDTLIIAGIHLHACVRETVLAAYELGFNVWVVDDAVGSDDPVHAAITRRYLASRAARFTPVAELLKQFAPSNPTPAAINDKDGATCEVAAAATKARAAWPTWTTSTPETRRKRLERLAAILEGKAQSLADQMAREIGKPIAFGQIEVERTAGMMREMARNDLTMQATAPGNAARRRALGVVAIITPWNNPFLIPLGKIAAAVLYGNTVVWKPAPAAVSLADELMKCLHAAGWEGMVELVQGDIRHAVALMSDPRVDAITITGGLAAGYAAQEICARRYIPLQAELGGNNAAIIWPDCDLDDAVARIADGAFAQAGQRCTANRRVIVHQDCYEEFLKRIVPATAALSWGNPLERATRIGPLVSERQRERIAAFIARAEQAGAKIIVPHGTREFSGFPLASAAHPATIVCCDDPTMEIVQEESFGPVLVVQKATDWDEAIGFCNGVRQGLVAAIFTPLTELQEKFLAEAQAGVLKINQATADVTTHLPFGGWKASGVGPPEHGLADQEFFTRIQTIYRPAPQHS
jgi:acyl-CoA reductase-like NAD-dependent aldehyde dehydrogenase